MKDSTLLRQTNACVNVITGSFASEFKQLFVEGETCKPLARIFCCFSQAWSLTQIIKCRLACSSSNAAYQGTPRHVDKCQSERPVFYDCQVGQVIR